MWLLPLLKKIIIEVKCEKQTKETKIRKLNFFGGDYSLKKITQMVISRIKYLFWSFSDKTMIISKDKEKKCEEN